MTRRSVGRRTPGGRRALVFDQSRYAHRRLSLAPGGPVCLDESEVTLHEHADLRCYLAAEPESTVGEQLHWEVRKTGPAALGCAFVAAGLLRVARFESPDLWDVAGGLVLGRGAKREARERIEERRRRLAPIPFDELGSRRRPLSIGEAKAVDALTSARS